MAVTSIWASKAMRADLFSLLVEGRAPDGSGASSTATRPSPQRWFPTTTPAPRSSRLPRLSVLYPQVAPQRRQSAQAEDGHGHAVGLEGFGSVGVRGISPLHVYPLVGLLHVGLRPVGSQGAQQQPGDDALTLPEGRQRSQSGR